MTSGGGSRRRRDKGEHPTRRLLIETTLRVLDVRGFGDTLLEDVVDAAGVTKGALYHHFESFAALVDVALGERFDAAVGAELDALSRGVAQSRNVDDFLALLVEVITGNDADPSDRTVGWTQVLALVGVRATLHTRLTGGRGLLVDGYAAAVTTGRERGWVDGAIDSQRAASVLASLCLTPVREPVGQVAGKQLHVVAVAELLDRYLRA